MNYRLPRNALTIDLLGTALLPEEHELLLHPLVSGVIFFARNYESLEQITTLVKAIRQVRPDLVLSVDQEGGRVQRFVEGFTSLAPLSSIGEIYDTQGEAAALEAAYTHAFTMGRELKRVDIDISYAPVLDLERGISTVMATRCFHSVPGVVSTLAREYIKGMKAAGMPAIAKHFPGHGSVAADSHIDFPVDERDFDTVMSMDLVPFCALLEHFDGIMPAHVVYPAVDDKPASFSSKWLRDMLRGRLKFKGQIVSDDVSMQAASVMGSMPERVCMAIEAGCDNVLLCNDRKGVIEVLNYYDQNTD